MSKNKFNIRIHFIRGEEVKFISHLDIMRTFGRAMRRAKIPVAYTQGFNPQPIIVFGLPLSVGVTSLTEYADIELTETVSPEGLKDTLNKELPAGLKILNADVKHDQKNIMSLIYAASYEIFVCTENNETTSKIETTNKNDITNKIKKFLKKDTIEAIKEGKKGTKEIDIKPMIFDLDIKTMDKINMISNKYIDRGDVYKITALLRAGGEANLKPDLLISAINKHTDLDLKIIRIHRTGLFINKDGILVKPL
ncbi:MAG: DUF2344 domain-containing protein [Clostridiaceae bacterium]|jgi:radical SAM-linked protein|nr:DUF2344 domain-containing protein [Clostridiaceae bacterium]